MFVSWDCCVLSGRGFCDELVTRPGESYRLWYAVECDLGTSRMSMSRPVGGGGGFCARKKKNGVTKALFTGTSPVI